MVAVIRRRRTPVLALLLCSALLAAPAAARGETSWSLSGPISPSGSVDIQVTAKRKHGQRLRTYALSFTDIPLECDGGPATFDLSNKRMTLPASYHPASFGLGASVLGPHHKVIRAWSFEATVTGREHAEGTVRVRGTKVPIGNDQRDNCDSGRLDWTAELVA